MPMKFCPFCGNELNPEAAFCGKCGNKLDVANAQTTKAVPDASTSFQQPPVTNTPYSQTVAFPTSAPAYPGNVPSYPNAVPVTTGNIIPPVAFADEGARLIAMIIDGFILGFISSFFLFPGFNAEFNFIGIGVSSIIAFLYYFGLEALTGGQTLGKMLFGIRTVDQYTLQKATPLQYALHALGKAFFLVIDIIIGLIAKDEQTPATKSQVRATQRLSKTVVVKTKYIQNGQLINAPLP
jgi:uncharacterized RDD family membrane protein YckC